MSGAHPARLFERRHHVTRSAGSAQSQQHRAFAAVCCHLACKDRIERAVVAPGREHGRIFAEADDPERAPIPQEPRHEFARNMHGIRRRPAIAAHQQRTTAGKRRHDTIDSRFDRLRGNGDSGAIEHFG